MGKVGSVRQLVDEPGDVVLAQTFDPYGNPFQSDETGESAFAYTGEQTDANGFVFMRSSCEHLAIG